MLFGVKTRKNNNKGYIGEIIDSFHILNKNNYIISIILILFISAFVFRLYLQQNVNFVTGDTSHYLDLARNIVEKNSYLSDAVTSPYSTNQKTVPFYEGFRPIGYPIIISYIAQFLSQDYLLSGKMMCVLAGSFLIFPTFLISKSIFNTKIGLFSSVLVAFFPHLVFLSVVPYTDIIYGYLALLSIYFLCFKSSDKDTLIILGILMSASFMIRYQSLNLIFVVFATYLFHKNRLKNLAIILTSFVIATFPLFLYKYLTFSSPFFMDIIPFSVYDPRSMAIGLTAPTSLTTIIIENPFGFLIFFANSFAKNLVNLHIYFAPNIAHPLLSPLLSMFALISGLVIFIGSVCSLRKWKNIFPLYLFIFSSIAFVSIRLGAGVFWRKLIPLFPILLIFFVIGIIGIMKWITQSFDKKWNNHQIINKLANKTLVIFILFIVLLSSYAIWSVVFINSSHFVNGMNDLERSTDWIINHTSEDDVVMTQGYWDLLYHSNRKLVAPPSDYADMLTVASRYNIQYLLLNENILSNWGHRQDLIDRFFNGSFPSAFVPIYKYEYNNYLVRVFEINQTISANKWYNIILSLGEANFSDNTFKPVYNRSDKVEIDFSIKNTTPMLLFFSIESNDAASDQNHKQILINNNSLNLTQVSIIPENKHDFYIVKVNESNIITGKNKIVISDVQGNGVTLDFIEVYQQLDTLYQTK